MKDLKCYYKISVKCLENTIKKLNSLFAYTYGQRKTLSYESLSIFWH